MALQCGVAHVPRGTVVAAVPHSLAFLLPGPADAFIIRFVCNGDLYPGVPKFLHRDIDSRLGIWNTFFDFETALACVPSPVDCLVTGEPGRVCLRLGVSVCVYVCVCVVCVCDVLQAA